MTEVGRHVWGAQRLVLGLLLVSVVAAAIGSRAQHPYSDHFPKRIMLQHLHLLGPDGQLQASAAYPDLCSRTGLWLHT